jgi:hypothetical protein
MNMGDQLSALSAQENRRWSFVVGRWSFATRFAYNLFKHKNAPAMLPEHWIYLMAES